MTARRIALLALLAALAALVVFAPELALWLLVPGLQSVRRLCAP